MERASIVWMKISHGARYGKVNPTCRNCTKSLANTEELHFLFMSCTYFSRKTHIYTYFSRVVPTFHKKHVFIPTFHELYLLFMKNAYLYLLFTSCTYFS